MIEGDVPGAPERGEPEADTTHIGRRHAAVECVGRVASIRLLSGPIADLGAVLWRTTRQPQGSPWQRCVSRFDRFVTQ